MYDNSSVRTPANGIDNKHDGDEVDVNEVDIDDADVYAMQMYVDVDDAGDVQDTGEM